MLDSSASPKLWSSHPGNLCEVPDVLARHMSAFDPKRTPTAAL